MITKDQLQVRIKPVAEMEQHDLLFSEDSTKWEFVVPQEVFDRVFKAVSDRVCYLFDLFTDNGRFSCPAMGDVGEGYAWVEVCKKGSLIESLSLDESARQISIWVINRPQNPEDLIDPDHPEWKTGSPLQWVDVATFMRQFLVETGEIKW